MTIADLLKLKPEEIADACQGNETSAYTLLRSATSQLRARIEERIAADRLALGGDPDAAGLHRERLRRRAGEG